MLYGDGVHNQPYDSCTVSMIIFDKVNADAYVV